MLNVSKQLFDSWNEDNIEYCHWKSNEHLEAGLDGNTDLDILISDVDYEKAINNLKILGCIKCKSQYGSRYCDVEDWIGFDSDTGKLIHIHLHKRMITGHKGMKEYTLPWQNEALKERCYDAQNNVYIMNPELEIMTLIVRIFLKMTDKRALSIMMGKTLLNESDRKEISYLKKKISKDKLLEYANKYSIDSNDIIDFIEKEKINKNDLLQLRKSVLKSMRKYNNNTRLVSKIIEYYMQITLRLRVYMRKHLNFNILLRKTPETSGKVITFIGQDGSGKSTVSIEIEKWLTWKMEAKRFYLGSGEHYYSWQKTIRNRLPDKKNKFTKALSGWLALSDYVKLSKRTLKTMKKSQIYVRKGGFAIFDRYPQVKYSGINDGPKIREFYLPKIKNKFLRKYALICAGKEEKYLKLSTSYSPDIVFKLMLSPEESVKRKPKENLNVVQRKHMIIKEWEFPESMVYNIDAMNDYEKELIEIKTLIWDNIRT